MQYKSLIFFCLLPVNSTMHTIIGLLCAHTIYYQLLSCWYVMHTLCIHFWCLSFLRSFFWVSRWLACFPSATSLKGRTGWQLMMVSGRGINVCTCMENKCYNILRCGYCHTIILRRGYKLSRVSPFLRVLSGQHALWCWLDTYTPLKSTTHYDR